MGQDKSHAAEVKAAKQNDRDTKPDEGKTEESEALKAVGIAPEVEAAKAAVEAFEKEEAKDQSRSAPAAAALVEGQSEPPVTPTLSRFEAAGASKVVRGTENAEQLHKAEHDLAEEDAAVPQRETVETAREEPKPVAEQAQFAAAAAATLPSNERHDPEPVPAIDEVPAGDGHPAAFAHVEEPVSETPLREERLPSMQVSSIT